MWPSKNTRQQELYLLAKGKYGIQSEDFAKAARYIVAWSIGMDVDTMNYKDVAAVVTGAFVESDIVLKDRSRIARFLIGLGPDPVFKSFGRSHEIEGGYFAALIRALLDEVHVTIVYDKDKWLLPFKEVKDGDPKMMEMLNLHLKVLPEIREVSAG